MNDGGLSLTVATPIGTAVQIGRMIVEVGAAAGPSRSDPPVLAGRTGELSGLHRLLTAGAPGVVVSGPGGAGKTALAWAWAAGRTGRVVHADLRRGPSGALRGTLRSLGVGDQGMPGGAEDRRALLGSLIGPDGGLVVDGALSEDEVRAVAPAGVTVVVTARTPLPGLLVDGWADLPLAGLDPVAALAVLGAGGDLGWSAADPALAAVVRHCAGMPRALAQLAGPARAHGSPADLLAALDTATPAALARDHLGAQASALLDRLVDSGVVDVDEATAAALFGGPCTRELAELVEHALLDALPGPGWQLVAPAADLPPQRSAVAATPAAPRDVTRIAVAAADALARAGALSGEAAVRLDLAAYELGASRPAGAVEHATRAALAFAAVDDHEGGTRATLLLGRALVALGEAEAALDCLDAALRRLPPGADRVVAQASRGEALESLGHADRATEAFELAATVGAAGPAAARAWRGIAEAHLRLGDGAGALDAYRQAAHVLGPGVDPRLRAALDEVVDVRLETRAPEALRSLVAALSEGAGEAGAIQRGVAALTGSDLLVLFGSPDTATVSP